MDPLNLLLTGIPRSGTTLCCKLLNELDNTVALHEPIDPQKLSSCDTREAVTEIQKQVLQIRQALIHGDKFEHGDSQNLSLENPVGLDTQETGLRALAAQRGFLQAPKQNQDVRIIVKQNALFTALSQELVKHYKLVAIVRNPVDVLLSWMTVDLPVNQGKLPAGEKFDSMLAAKLKNTNVVENQITIYQWFIDKFTCAGLQVLRYEDIVATSGNSLYQAFGASVNQRDKALTAPCRSYSEVTLNRLRAYSQPIKDSLTSRWYSTEEIDQALERVMGQTVVGK